MHVILLDKYLYLCIILVFILKANCKKYMYVRKNFCSKSIPCSNGLTKSPETRHGLTQKRTTLLQEHGRTETHAAFASFQE